MSNSFVPFLVGSSDIHLRDYQHASKLYLSNYYELTPKPAWIYFVEININRDVRNSIYDKRFLLEFDKWYERYSGKVGLLAKNVDTPRFKIETEVLNQYNRKSVIQKKINYTPLSLTFHDDMANATTNLWKSYYQYYYGDSVRSSGGNVNSKKPIKFDDKKYSPFISVDYDQYGLNNNQNVPFFSSIEIYQLYRKKYTSFKIVNPLISEWSHDALDQSAGNKLLSSKMTLEYETLIYDTSSENNVTKENPGFYNEHYDQSDSPLSISVNNFELDRTKLPPGPEDLYGKLDNPPPTILDLYQTIPKIEALARNIRNFDEESVKEIGKGLLFSVIGGIPIDGSANSDKLSDLAKQGTVQAGQGFIQEKSGGLGISIPFGKKILDVLTPSKQVKTQK